MGRKKTFLSSGPRIDFVSLRNGYPTLLFGYELKFYPFKLKNRDNHQGVFTGIAPVVFPKISGDHDRRHGPGLSMLVGYQHSLSNGLSVSLEGSWTYLKDLNKLASQFNADGIYLYPFLNVKVGKSLDSREGSRR